MEEAGSKVNHRRKKDDRHPGIYALSILRAFASADGHKSCMDAAVSSEVPYIDV